ncbi:hypothetical protein ARHIZOSPH14_25540 [Agromyces rhizosphaerae]|uniref:Bacterial Ig domain-containing protein n=1 Tax=Agromyces rhizosphaerae TaxID=88374 RepID=A0A9W6CZZ6_9MICO|nr:Ig-like domain-containing protein [Agromyces rhizosphaerae]GLI28312.1 hypothetical protein ARHIZOSPH14_25540 [Agromyces rhizosphaerae]
MHVEGHRTAADVAARSGVRRARVLRLGVAALLGLAIAALAGTAPAAAAPTAPPGLVPTIDSPADGDLVLERTVDVSGTRPAGVEVTLTDPADGGPLCVVPAEASTDWSCRVTLPDGPRVPIRASADTGAGTTSDEITVAVLGPPFVRVPDGATDGTVAGLAYPGAEVDVTDHTGGSCAATAGTDREWSCRLSGGSGTERRVRATQSTGFSAPTHSTPSSAITVLVDLAAPAAPFVRSPRDGTALETGATTARGIGEPGAEVTVYEAGEQLCTTTVGGDGTWTCAIRVLGAGSHVLTALQTDTVGNISSPTAITVTVGDAAGSTGDDGSGAGGADGGDSTAPDADGGTANALEAGSSGAGASDWARATDLTTALPSATTASTLPWLGALVAALIAIVAVALPARLIPAAAGADNPAIHPAGRNRVAADFDRTPVVPIGRRVAIALSVVVASLLALITTPVADLEPALRTLLAIGVALAIVNSVASVLPALVMRRVPAAHARTVAAPAGIVLVAVASFLARVVGFDAVVLFGVVTRVRFDGQSPASVRIRVAVMRVAGLLVLAMAAWVALAFAPATTGFVPTLVADVLTVVTLSAATSAAALLVPLPHTAGRTIMNRSPLTWALLALGAAVLVALLVSARYAESALPVLAPALAAGLAVIAGVAAVVRLRRWRAARREDAARDEADAPRDAAAPAAR